MSDPQTRPAPSLDDDPGSDESPVAPPVVAVLVAHDPGWWFAETLGSIAAQDYQALSVLVVDAGSADAEGLRARVAEVLPDAHLLRIDANPGYAAAAEQGASAVEGAAFLLHLHDDVRLAPDAVRMMVEEAYRSNAGIIGPKLVQWDDERRLLSVGMGADRFGHPAPYVERGDLDQEQLDAVRDVFYIPGAATLVRADLHRALGGFDTAMTFHGEDLDLCWRAHVAGARVLVAPAAVVAHLEALGARRPDDDRRRLQSRHRLRAMRADDSVGTRVRAVPEAFVLSLLEIVQGLVLGHFRRVRDIWGAWVWNASNRSTLSTRRSSLAAVRRVPDSDVHDLQRRGSARLAGYLRARLGRTDESGWEFVSNLRASSTSTSVIVAGLLALFLLIGGRELILDGIPQVGDFVRLLGPGQMLSEWKGGLQSVGVGSTAPAPTGFGLLGLLATVLFGATGLLRAVLILGLWPLGALGMWRIMRAFGSRRSRILGTVAYVTLPVAANAMATGQWGALAAYAVLPWILSQLAAASGVAPFSSGDGSDELGGVKQRPLLHRAVLVGLLAALAAAIDPAVLVVVAGTAVALVLGFLIAGGVTGTLRVLAVGAGGVVVALVLHLPWSLTFLGGWSAIVGTSSSGGFPLDLADVLRFGTGPFGTGVLGWCFLVAGALPLVIGRSWRLAWAVRGWVLALVGFGVVWAIGQGWLIGYVPQPTMLLVPAACGMAIAIGLGIASFEADLPDYHFGWRQILSLLAAVAFVAALLQPLAAAMSGRWDLPRSDFAKGLSFLDGQQDDGAYRVLWIGDAASLPMNGWSLDAPTIDALGSGRDLAFATTDGGASSIAQQWPGPIDEGGSQLAAALQTAADGGSARLGALLSPMAVKYVVVPLAPAPDPYARSRTFVPTELLAMLDGQLDLASVTVNPGVRVYRNSAWQAGIASFPAKTRFPDGGNEISSRVFSTAKSEPVLAGDGISRDMSGELSSAGEVYVSSAGGADWHLRVDGNDVARDDAFGWASVFHVDRAGPATLVYDAPTARLAMLAGQIVLWIGAIVFVLRMRSKVEERRRLDGDEA